VDTDGGFQSSYNRCWSWILHWIDRRTVHVYERKKTPVPKLDPKPINLLPVLLSKVVTLIASGGGFSLGKGQQRKDKNIQQAGFLDGHPL
jgi:hypothetical protein